MAQRLKGRYGYPADDPFRPTFHTDKRYEPEEVKKPSRIFVCSQGELFAEGQDDWVKIVLNSLATYPQHIFLFLTKNYDQLPRWNPWPINAWVGASVTNSEQFADAHKTLIQVRASVRFISFEPLMGEIVYPNYPLRVPLAEAVNWIIIGGMTGPRPQRPAEYWVRALENAADEVGIPVFEKDNLGIASPRREFPDAAS